MISKRALCSSRLILDELLLLFKSLICHGNIKKKGQFQQIRDGWRVITSNVVLKVETFFGTHAGSHDTQGVLPR